MCGIVGGRGRVQPERVQALAHRGPDGSGTWQGKHFWLGHTRLAILDPEARSDQPFHYGDTVVAYNGELWNFRELRAELLALSSVFRTTGDTEVVAAALDRWGADALPRMEGMFALAWSSDGGETLHVARDRFGEVPLHCGGADLFASELKALPSAGARWFPPGAVMTLGPGERRAPAPWYQLTRRPVPAEPERVIRGLLAAGTRERTVSDCGLCVLLSGGIDSSAIAYHLAAGGLRPRAYCAVGKRDSADVRNARRVAGELGLELVEVPVPPPTAEDLSRVVHVIEQPSKPQVEIAWACLHLAERIAADGIKVTLSGEGSDELWGSYGRSGYHGIQAEGWFAYRRRIFHEQHRKNFARTNKVFMRHGVECRLPFLSTALVETALALPLVDVHRETGYEVKRKRILADAYRGALPPPVLERLKMTFQEGAGLSTGSAAAVADPLRFIRAEFRAAYPGASA